MGICLENSPIGSTAVVHLDSAICGEVSKPADDQPESGIKPLL